MSNTGIVFSQNLIGRNYLSTMAKSMVNCFFVDFEKIWKWL